MTGAGRWLAAAAMLTLTAAIAGEGQAATRTRAHAHATSRTAHAHRRVTHRRARRPAVQAATTGKTAPMLVLVPPPQPDPKRTAVVGGRDVAPPIYTPAAPAADPVYRWLDDADAMMGAVDGGAPDGGFTENGAPRFVWRLNDGAMVIAASVDGDTRWFFYAPDTTAPFLVRERQDSFAFQNGRNVATFDENGRLIDWATARIADALYAQGRRLWYAASRPQQTVAPSWSIDLSGGFGGWRDNDGWRRWRDAPNRGPDPHDRYRAEHDARRAGGGTMPQPPRDGGRSDQPRYGGGWTSQPQSQPGQAAAVGEPRQQRQRPTDARGEPAHTGFAGRPIRSEEPLADGTAPATAYTPPAPPAPRVETPERPAYTPPPQPVAVERPAPAPEPAYRAPEPQPAPREPERAAPPPQPAPPPAPAPAPPRQPTLADQKREAANPSDPPAD